jgi:tRNA (cytidine/uridine-2'-O-)-methyltransferase
MLTIVLVTPLIATNTGNIVRLCANTGADLHLVEPLGFDLDSSRLRRAGLDYHDLTHVVVHASIDEALGSVGRHRRRFALSASASRRYHTVTYRSDDVLVFGAERAGLTGPQLAAIAPAEPLAIPMQPGNRSLNLANAVAVVLYEAWRQLGFSGATGAGGTTTYESLGT